MTEIEREACVHCGETMFNEPCVQSGDRLHWTPAMLLDAARQKNEAYLVAMQAMSRQLQATASAIEALPERQRRRLERRSAHLMPGLLRNEAGRGTDMASLFGAY